MARLSKTQAANKQSFKYSEEDVPTDEIAEGTTVLVRSLSVGERDAFQNQVPDEAKDWKMEHTSLLFATVVKEPKFTKTEAEEILPDWPAEVLDRIVGKFNDMMSQVEVKRDAAGEFPAGSESESGS